MSDITSVKEYKKQLEDREQEEMNWLIASNQIRAAADAESRKEAIKREQQERDEKQRKERPFKEWTITKYHASYKGYYLWIGKGFSEFHDVREASFSFLSFMNWWQRRKVWKMICTEKEIRAEILLKELEGGK